jgi:adenosylcobinamide kinase / adenosylcobinamide-phosphate guanylyltransferase
MANQYPKTITFVLGGARSGKSAYAEKLVTALPAPWTYIATAQSFDEEMADRIAEHQARRKPGWVTVNAPLELGAAIRAVPSGQPILIDCLTLWVTNLMLGEQSVAQASQDLMLALAASHSPVVLVSNEVGFGIVPDNKLAREFRDYAGRLHQHVATWADHVVLIVAGLPMVVK